MAMKRVPLFVLVLLGAAAAFPGVAIAEEEEDSRCQVQMCASGLNGDNRCRTTHEAYSSCNERCSTLGCDGGTQIGDSFSCAAGTSPAFFLCQCNYCGGSGGGTGGGTGGGSGPGDGGGGIGCSDCLCSDEVCDDNCWWDGWDWGQCYLGECWCHANMND